MKSKINFPVIVMAIVIVGVAALFWFSLRGGEMNENTPVAVLARCLADKGVTMYGAEWCSHCQNQKNMFGEAFKLIPYVECPKNPAQCLAAGVRGYPTWIFPSMDSTISPRADSINSPQAGSTSLSQASSRQVASSNRLEGEQELEKLAKASGCVLPAQEQ